MGVLCFMAQVDGEILHAEIVYGRRRRNAWDAIFHMLIKCGAGRIPTPVYINIVFI